MTGKAATALLLNEADDVICLLRDHRAGERPVLEDGHGPALRQDTPLGHKIARRAIAKGAKIRKYGAVIGLATRDIAPGDHVHLHNLAGLLEPGKAP